MGKLPEDEGVEPADPEEGRRLPRPGVVKGLHDETDRPQVALGQTAVRPTGLRDGAPVHARFVWRQADRSRQESDARRHEDRPPDLVEGVRQVLGLLRRREGLLAGPVQVQVQALESRGGRRQEAVEQSGESGLLGSPRGWIHRNEELSGLNR